MVAGAAAVLELVVGSHVIAHEDDSGFWGRGAASPLPADGVTLGRQREVHVARGNDERRDDGWCRRSRSNLVQLAPTPAADSTPPRSRFTLIRASRSSVLAGAPRGS